MVICFKQNGQNENSECQIIKAIDFHVLVVKMGWEDVL